MKQDKLQRKQVHDIPAWEWAIAGIGAVLVAGVIGFLLYSAITDPASPPDIVIEEKAVLRTPSGYLMQIEVHNHGGSAAADLLIRGELHKGGETVETSEVTMKYAPAGSVRGAGLFFQHDPRLHKVVLLPRGYEEP